MSDDGITLDQVIGRNMRRLRREWNLTQEDLARAARGAGLSLSRSTVAELEGGARRVAVAELMLLVEAFRILSTEIDGASEPTARDLLANPEPTDDSQVHLSDMSTAPAEQLAAFVVDGRVPGLHTPSSRAMANVRNKLEALAEPHAEALAEEWVQRLARSMEIPTLFLAMNASRLWGRSITEERAARVAAAGVSHPAEIGHITREMKRELIEELEGRRLEAERSRARRRQTRKAP